MNEKAIIDKGINEIVGVFTDPIIVMPGGWGDTLPDWIKEAITLERLTENVGGLKNGKMTATDAEACAYLYTASLEAPMGHDWSQVYLYITGKVYERHRTQDSGDKMPEDIRVETLTRNQQDDLDHLKSWIYETRLKHRKGKASERRKEEKAQKEAESPTVLQHSFDLWGKD